jgi:DNA-binding MarR family transcriptional regulator
MPRKPAPIIRSVDTKRLIRIGVDTGAGAAGTDDAWRQFTFGRLLLFAFSEYETRVLDAYRAAGYPDVRQVHFSVTRHIDTVAGSRVGDLAARAGITKAAMGQLVAECARLDLVSLSSDPSDGRAKVVRLTKRGHELLSVTQRCSKQIEAEFTAAIGAKKFGALREGLVALREELTWLARKDATPA